MKIQVIKYCNISVSQRCPPVYSSAQLDSLLSWTALNLTRRCPGQSSALTQRFHGQHKKVYFPLIFSTNFSMLYQFAE